MKSQPLDEILAFRGHEQKTDKQEQVHMDDTPDNILIKNRRILTCNTLTNHCSPETTEQRMEAQRKWNEEERKRKEMQKEKASRKR